MKRGVVCLAFLILGYQLALFTGKAAILKIESNRDKPDTVFIYIDSSSSAGGLPESPHGSYTLRHNADHSPGVETVRKATRRTETFRFNPNTVSVEELVRLGFSEKQAASIDSYRAKGGRFHRREDFAKSFVVSDSVYRRLERYIDIPLLDINRADSADFDALPGIGGYFASRMVSYRERLGAYSYPEQLMDIPRFDEERYNALKDLICCSECEPFALWSLPAEELRKHPYVKDWRTARAIVLFRENSPADSLTPSALARAGILSPETAAKLSRCRLE